VSIGQEPSSLAVMVRRGSIKQKSSRSQGASITRLEIGAKQRDRKGDATRSDLCFENRPRAARIGLDRRVRV